MAPSIARRMGKWNDEEQELRDKEDGDWKYGTGKWCSVAHYVDVSYLECVLVCMFSTIVVHIA